MIASAFNPATASPALQIGAVSHVASAADGSPIAVNGDTFEALMNTHAAAGQPASPIAVAAVTVPGNGAKQAEPALALETDVVASSDAVIAQPVMTEGLSSQAVPSQTVEAPLATPQPDQAEKSQLQTIEEQQPSTQSSQTQQPASLDQISQSALQSVQAQPPALQQGQLIANSPEIATVQQAEPVNEAASQALPLQLIALPEPTQPIAPEAMATQRKATQLDATEQPALPLVQTQQPSVQSAQGELPRSQWALQAVQAQAVQLQTSATQQPVTEKSTSEPPITVQSAAQPIQAQGPVAQTIQVQEAAAYLSPSQLGVPLAVPLTQSMPTPAAGAPSGVVLNAAPARDNGAVSAKGILLADSQSKPQATDRSGAVLPLQMPAAFLTTPNAATTTVTGPTSAAVLVAPAVAPASSSAGPVPISAPSPSLPLAPSLVPAASLNSSLPGNPAQSSDPAPSSNKPAPSLSPVPSLSTAAPTLTPAPSVNTDLALAQIQVPPAVAHTQHLSAVTNVQSDSAPVKGGTRSDKSSRTVTDPGVAIVAVAAPSVPSVEMVAATAPVVLAPVQQTMPMPAEANAPADAPVLRMKTGAGLPRGFAVGQSAPATAIAVATLPAASQVSSAESDSALSHDAADAVEQSGSISPRGVVSRTDAVPAHTLPVTNSSTPAQGSSPLVLQQPTAAGSAPDVSFAYSFGQQAHAAVDPLVTAAPLSSTSVLTHALSSPLAASDTAISPAAPTSAPLRHLDVSVTDGVFGTVGVRTEMRDGVVHASISGGSDVVDAMPELHQFLQHNDIALHNVTVQHTGQTLRVSDGATLSTSAGGSGLLGNNSQGSSGQGNAQYGSAQGSSNAFGGAHGGSAQGRDGSGQGGGDADPSGQRATRVQANALRNAGAAALLADARMTSTTSTLPQGSTLSIHI